MKKIPFFLALAMLGLAFFSGHVFSDFFTDSTVNFFASNVYVKGPSGVAGGQNRIMVSWNFNYTPGTYPFTTPPNTYPFVDSEYYPYGLKWALLSGNTAVASEFATWVRTYLWGASGYMDQAWYHNGTVSNKSNHTGVDSLAARYLKDVHQATLNPLYLTWSQEAWAKVMSVYEVNCDAFWPKQRAFYATINPVGGGLNAGLAGQMIYEHRYLANTGYLNNTLLVNLANALSNNFYDAANGGWFFNRTCQNQPIDVGKDLHDMGWNIAGLVTAYREIGNSTYLSRAKAGADKIITKMWNSTDGSFNSRCFNNNWTNCEFSHDLYFQSTITFGLAELFLSTRNATYLQYALNQQAFFEKLFFPGKSFKFSQSNKGISIGENMWYLQARNSVSLALGQGSFIYPSSGNTLFQDDFLYANSLGTKFWNLDYTLSTAANTYTQAGFLVFRSGSSRFQEVHVASPVWTPDNKAIILRQMTVTLYPFEKKLTGTSTGGIDMGFAQLRKVGGTLSFPGNNPYGTPCGTNITPEECPSVGTFPNDNVASERIRVTNVGGVSVAWCGFSSCASQNLEPVNPTLFTVVSVSYRSDALYRRENFDFIYFKIYQLDSSGSRVSLQTYNATSNVLPTYNATYAFIRFSTDSANALPVSKVDFVDIRDYFGPVTINPQQFIPTPRPLGGLGSAPGFTNFMLAGAAWFGGGDVGLGALILFSIFASITTIPFLYLFKGLFVPMTVLLLDVGIFIYSGLLPTFVLFLILIGGALLTVMMIREMLVSRQGLGET